MFVSAADCLGIRGGKDPVLLGASAGSRGCGATSGRDCSEAWRVSFICQSHVVEYVVDGLNGAAQARAATDFLKSEIRLLFEQGPHLAAVGRGLQACGRRGDVGARCHRNDGAAAAAS